MNLSEILAVVLATVVALMNGGRAKSYMYIDNKKLFYSMLQRAQIFCGKSKM